MPSRFINISLLNNSMTKTVLTPVDVHYVLWRFRAGGAELSVRHYGDRLPPRHRLHAYSLRGGTNEIYDDSKIRLQLGSPGTWKCYQQYFHYCRKHKQHIFHLLNVGPIVLLLTLLAGVKNPVYHIHGTIYWNNRREQFFLKKVWQLSNFFNVKWVANSAYSADIFNRQVLPVRPQVIYNGFEIQKFLEKRSLRSALRKIGYAGRFHTGKNVELVIRLFGEIAADYPEVELHLAGDGPLRPLLENLIQKSPYQERIHLLGFVQDIAAFYQSIDLFVFLSAYESFGNVLAEALLTGLPVLTSDVPVFAEITEGEPMFLLGNPSEEEHIRRNFRAAIAHYPLLAEKALALSNRLEQKFSLDQHIIQIERVYETP